MSSKILSIDIETTGLDPYRDNLTLVGGLDEDKYYPTRTKDEFRSVISNHPEWQWVGHNFSFDIRFLIVKGWISSEEMRGRIHCTQLMAHVYRHKVPASYLEEYEAKRQEENKKLPKGQKHRKAGPLSLKVLAPYFLGVPAFWETPGNHDNEEYNEKDCRYTLQLFNYFMKNFNEDELTFYQTKMLPWSTMLLDMTLRGIHLNEDKLQEAASGYADLVTQLEGKLDEVWREAHLAYERQVKQGILGRYNKMLRGALAKGPTNPQKTMDRYQELRNRALIKLAPEDKKINYDSPKQMLWLLKDHLGLNVTKVDLKEDDENEHSTGKAVLHRLASEGREDIQTFLEWRASQKILTGFLPKYKELAVDGVLHPTFNLTGTRTGRISSSKPNLQQVPPKLYSLFKPRDGYTFLQYDLSGIEAALIALYSNDTTLYDILNQDISIHDYNTKVLFNLPESVDEIKERYPRQRQTVKNIGFACFYGAGANRLEAVFKTAGFMIDNREAKRMLGVLKGTYPGAFSFHKEITELFLEGGVIHNLLGRPVSIQDRDDCYMKGFNKLIQSSASDLNLHACEKSDRIWKQQSLDSSPLLVIHDCIIAEAKSDHAAEASKILVDSMTNYDLHCDNGPIKLKVEGGVADEWTK